MLTVNYFKKHLIYLKPWDLSTVYMTTEWDNDTEKTVLVSAEYEEGKDPRVMMSMELWGDADWELDGVSSTNPYPIVGTELAILDLKFKIVGFTERYSVPQSAWAFDIVLEKI